MLGELKKLHCWIKLLNSIMNKFYVLLFAVLTVAGLSNFSYAVGTSANGPEIKKLTKGNSEKLIASKAPMSSKAPVATDSVVEDDGELMENSTIIVDSKGSKEGVSNKSLNVMYSNICKDAESFYSKGNYNDALEKYLQVYKDGKMSADLYYNIANCYFKLGKNSKAILFYERAKLLSPNDNMINYNLNMARARVIDKIEPVPVFFATRWLRYFEKLFTADVWSYMAVAFFLVFLIMLGLFFYSSSVRIKRNGFVIGIIVLIFTVASIVFAYHQYQRLNDKNTAIVMSPSVTVKGSPSESGTDLFLIHEGTKVNVNENVSGWYNIRLQDGNEGWVKHNTLEII